MSAETQLERRARDGGRRGCRRRLAQPLDHRSSSGPAAPLVVPEPTSSWSNRAIDRRRGRRRLRRTRGERGDRGPARHLVVETPAAPAACSSTPSTAAGWTSYSTASHARPARHVPSAAGDATWRSRSPPRRCPTPASGAACRSSTRPCSLTSRSRWMASCGTRASGRRSSTSVTRPVGACTSRPATAEIAVEPAVEEHAAVDLDAELAPPGALDVGSRLDPQFGESVWAPTTRSGAAPAGCARRQATSAPPRTV